jgi:hypothetical protein
MKVYSKNIGLIFLLFMTIISCHKDSDSFETSVTSTVFTAVVVNEIKGNISGIISDESGIGIDGAMVQIYSTSVKTNKFGYFEMNNVGLDKNGTYLTAKKEGYFLGSDMIYPDKAENYSYVKMIKLQNPSTFNSNDGAQVNIVGGGSIIFQANGIASADGKIYNGNVNVYTKLISPSDKDLGEKMPGGLVGDRISKETVALGTYGMIAVEMIGEAGQRLNLLKDKSAIVRIPKISNNNASVVETWHFDESLGRWKEVGIAVLVNGFYEFRATHFSFWNVDAPFPLVNVCGSITFENGSPVKNARIQVVAAGLNTANGITDANGRYCGKMPKGKDLVLKVFASGCDNAIAEKSFSALTSDTEFPNITIPNNEIPQRFIKAKVECNGTAVVNARIIINVDGKLSIFKVKADGSIDENISNLACGNAKLVEAFALNTTNNEASPSQEIKINDLATKIFDICKPSCDFKAEIVDGCDGSMKVNVTNGSGNYSYKWSNGATTNQIILNANQQVDTSLRCVTITDLASNCTKTICKKYEKLSATIVGACDDTVKVITRTGQRPLSYLWSDGSKDSFLINKVSSETTVKVIVTDAKGCTLTISRVLLPHIKITQTPSTCSKDLFTLVSSSQFNGGYIFPGDSLEILQIANLQNLSVFQTGFSFEVSGLKDEECKRASIQLPRLKKFKVQEFKTSCVSCNDGYIDVLEASDCEKCTYGSFKVLKADKKTDVTLENKNKALAKGTYYAVADDKNGCYVEFKKVTIK